MKDSLPKLAQEQDAAPGLRAYSRGKEARKRQHARSNMVGKGRNPS